MSKPLPTINSDADAENLLEQDLSDFITPENFKPVTFEFLPKTEQINLRISKPLLEAVKAQADERGIGYQKYIRQLLEQSLTAVDSSFVTIPPN